MAISRALRMLTGVTLTMNAARLRSVAAANAGTSRSCQRKNRLDRQAERPGGQCQAGQVRCREEYGEPRLLRRETGPEQLRHPLIRKLQVPRQGSGR